MKKCPQCYASMGDSLSCPKCDFTPNTKGANNADWWRCCDVDRDGNRCSKPGSLAESTRGSDRWFCAVHFPPFKTRGYKRTPPPPNWKGPARSAASVAEDVLERQAIQSEGS